MKMKFFNRSMLLAATAGLFLASCNNDDNNGGGGPEPIDPIEEGLLTGSITEDVTLDAATTYSLTNTFSVESGATLTIPAGTQIIADASAGKNTDLYIVVQKGAQINIQGTADNPVVMTAAAAEPGSWGGLVIAGNATTTNGVDAVAEVGGILYGGNNDTDNSGIINYLVINYAGAAINADSQFNGLTLYAVGSETSISNVAALNGTDDGVEFFGGTASLTNFYSENNQDDSVDWTEGWNGTLANAYILHTEAGFSTAVEADGDNGNPTLDQFTAVSSVGGTALQFKKASGATINGLSLTGYATSVELANPDQGDFSFIQIDGADADPNDPYIAAPTVDVSQFAWAASATVGNEVLTGSLESDRTLDASVTYFLDNTYSVESGATLTIPAGTRIVADVESGEETSTYIVVQKGGAIDIQGTAQDPVVMTSANEEPGDWGGLVIAGDATTTNGVDATAEVGGILYGGTNDTDSSGNIDYLIINYAGAAINADSQFNGLTLYAVGSETTIDNVAALNGTDDGVEYFGGTVSTTNFYSENNQDDSVDWTEGWNGTLTNSYILHTEAGFSTAVEADGDNGNPTLDQFTAVSTVGGTALQFKKASGATINGLSLTGYDTSVELANPDQGDFSFIQIDGADADPNNPYIAPATVDINTFSWATDATVSNQVLTGSISSDLTLNANVEYFLDQTFSVEAGATLTIPAGTRITADVESGEETSTYIVIQKGAAIDVQGTADNPVVLTSANEEPGDWGGLVIAGDATTTNGIDATAEVGGILYGGTNDADSSGNIDYLIINYAGAAINADSQFNGLTLYAVGSETTIDNVAALNGTDDGVEYFGGTVSTTNFYSENNQDDSVDWTEGWNGTLSNSFILHTQAGFSTAVEADGDNGNPTLDQFTAVSTVGGTALQFKKASGATINGLSLDGYDISVELANPDQGDFSFIQIDGADADPANSYSGPATVMLSMFEWAGADPNQSFDVVLGGQITANTSLSPLFNYTLEGTLSVEAPAELTIPAGTTIVADPEVGEETNTYIVVQKGATIDIQGTAQDPVFMTSANQEPGDWGGLVIAGDASTTNGIDAVAEVGGILYGGTNDTDSSGNIDYLVINYAGAAINADSQFNGLTLYAVGSGTTIDNVATLNGTDDGVEFFGGTASLTNFYSENNQDDSVDWTEGWNGTLANAYILHTEAGFSTAVEADGDNGNPTLDQFTAISTVGGTALQFKKASGATINGLALNGYATSVELANPDQGSFDFIIIDGAPANPNLPYIGDPTVDRNSFDWVGSDTPVGTQVLTGSLTMDMTLDANVSYFLDNFFSVESGATLTIPAGTRIVADVEAGEETNTYIVVQKGGVIDIQGTAQDPVVMTSANEEPGDWGGLVIAGDATTTNGIDATAEVGGILYGGSNDTDSSGNIDYLIINYAGAAINADSQFNGLTLYAVGSETTIDNVAALNGTDDGVEFFGGTANANNFYSENNQDDSVDWTEGWNGTLSNSYIVHTEAGFSTAVEADGDNGNPTLDQFTAISTVGGTALQFKKASGATINGLSLDGYDISVELANPDQGDFSFIQIDGADADPNSDYNNPATVDGDAVFGWVPAITTF